MLGLRKHIEKVWGGGWIQHGALTRTQSHGDSVTGSRCVDLGDNTATAKSVVVQEHVQIHNNRRDGLVCSCVQATLEKKET